MYKDYYYVALTVTFPGQCGKPGSAGTLHLICMEFTPFTGHQYSIYEAANSQVKFKVARKSF